MKRTHEAQIAWLDRATAACDLGGIPSEIKTEAVRLLQAGSADRSIALPPNESPQRQVEILHALTALATQAPSRIPSRTIEQVFQAVQSLDLPDWTLHRDHLSSQLAVAAWRTARASGDLEYSGRWRARADKLLSELSNGVQLSELGTYSAQAESILDASIEDRDFESNGSRLDPELLLALLRLLYRRSESSPLRVRAESEFFFHLVESRRFSIDGPDERYYFPGEFALLAGSCCRVLARREDAHQWFARADDSFSHCSRHDSLVVRTTYQRLALASEERRFDLVLEKAPSLSVRASSLGLAEESLKCRMLIGLALNERGQFEHAARELDCVRQEASKASIPRLAALAGTNLAISYEAIGRLEDALQASTEALPILVRLDNQVGLVKLQWHLGDVLRKLGKESEAIKAYGNACKNAERVGVRGDVAALHLVVAELLLDMGLDSEAEQEVRAALPIIDEEKMVPEGFAALSLLRESLRRRKLDRGALRTLHGYFKE